MKIHFYAHASFRLEVDGLRLVTDPDRPGPRGAGFAPIDEPAEFVIRSSIKDIFHNDPSHVRGNPRVIDALKIPEEGMRIETLELRGFPARERIRWIPLLFGGRLPLRYAMYSIHSAREGLRVLHGGDLGGPLKQQYIDALAGNVDVFFAITGGVHNVELDDLDPMIQQLRPRVVIPMHYRHPQGRLKTILPVTAFTDRYPKESVRWVNGPDVEITRESLPDSTKIYVLEPSR
jgi:L-ascorbate metabolism protein UlaG (beta-lactamase superfamily)